MSALTDRIRALRASEPGLSAAEIATRVGCTRSYAAKVLQGPEEYRALLARQNAKHRSYKRQWERDHRRVCRCGAQCKGDICRDCYLALERARVVARAKEIAALWADGLTVAEIGARFGWTANHTGVQIHRIRTEGLADVPHRNRRSVAA